MGGVLGPAEAGLDQREAGLHEDDQHCPDDDPEQVDLLTQRGDRLDRVNVLGCGRTGEQADQTARHDEPSKELAAHVSSPPWWLGRGLSGARGFSLTRGVGAEPVRGTPSR